MMIMKNVKIDVDGPGTVMVGDVVFHIIRSKDGNLTLGVNAPKEMPISTSWNWKKSQSEDPQGTPLNTDR